MHTFYHLVWYINTVYRMCCHAQLRLWPLQVEGLRALFNVHYSWSIKVRPSIRRGQQTNAALQLLNGWDLHHQRQGPIVTLFFQRSKRYSKITIIAIISQRHTSFALITTFYKKTCICKVNWMIWIISGHRQCKSHQEFFIFFIFFKLGRFPSFNKNGYSLAVWRNNSFILPWYWI